MSREYNDIDTKVGEQADLYRTEEYRQLQLDKALLIVLVGTDTTPTFVIEESATIGRSLDSSVTLREDDVSRQHAIIRRERPGIFVIEDLGSKNGTLVNGIPVEKQLLKYGDKIRIGARAVLMFSRYDRLEDKLMQSQRLESIGRIAGGVAHDFNNILGAVLANVGFMKGLSQDITFGDTDVQECLGDIDTAARRAVDLTRQLLGLARKDRQPTKEVCLGSVVQEVAALARRTFDPNVIIFSEMEKDLIIKGDSSQLHQMLMNLCINARDAMPDGGNLCLKVARVQISSEDSDRLLYLRAGLHAVIEVSDTGTGMDERTQKRLFEPFYTTKKEGKGTGLGLATVMSIVKHHGGHIVVKSEIGQGTTFRIHLPATEKQDPISLAEKEFVSNGTRRIHTGKVLLVDDEEVFLNSARRLLEGLGYFVVTAKDGGEAVHHFATDNQSIELVLLDLVMPNMGGAETFYALREIDPQVKILLSSGRTELGGVRDLLAAGAHGFLQKPYDAGALGEAISRVLFSST